MFPPTVTAAMCGAWGVCRRGWSGPQAAPGHFKPEMFLVRRKLWCMYSGCLAGCWYLNLQDGPASLHTSRTSARQTEAC